MYGSPLFLVKVIVGIYRHVLVVSLVDRLPETEMKVPYIGVTDFTTIGQVSTAKKLFRPQGPRRLQVGAMMSYKTLHALPTKLGWESVWLNEEQLNKLFVRDARVFNVLRYRDITTYPKTTKEDLFEAVRRAGPGIDGIVLDIVLPDARLVDAVKNKFPDLEIIIQVQPLALERIKRDQAVMRRYLATYKERGAQYVMLGMSLGKGKQLPMSAILNSLLLCHEYFDDTSLAVTGGLGPYSLQLLDSIIRRYPHISWDAQEQLRESGSPHDQIEMRRVMMYLDHSLRKAKKALAPRCCPP